MRARAREVEIERERVWWDTAVTRSSTETEVLRLKIDAAETKGPRALTVISPLAPRNSPGMPPGSGPPHRPLPRGGPGRAPHFPKMALAQFDIYVADRSVGGHVPPILVSLDSNLNF